MKNYLFVSFGIQYTFCLLYKELLIVTGQVTDGVDFEVDKLENVSEKKKKNIVSISGGVPNNTNKA